MTTSELAKTEDSYGLVVNRITECLQTIRDNLAGQKVDEFDLDRIHVPSGKGLSWQISGLVEAEEKEIRGVVVHQRISRAFWHKGLDEGKKMPPDCQADDSLTGIGNPGGNCEVCQFARFGSAIKGSGQACRQTHALFILRPGQLLPAVVVVPPTSLKQIKRYNLSLISAGHSLSAVETVLFLSSDKNSEGQPFARVEIGMADKLDPDAANGMARYAAELLPVLGGMSPRSFDREELIDITSG